jgi:nickel-dependent lactate racemase
LLQLYQELSSSGAEWEKGGIAIFSLQKINGKALYCDRLENVEVAIPEELCAGLVSAAGSVSAADPGSIARAFQNPVNSARLKDIAKGAKNVVLLVSDSTRAVPTAEVLPFIVEELTEAGIHTNQIKAVVGTGVHRPARDEEMRSILGEEFLKRIMIENHDPYDEKKLVDIGSTTFGTPLRINKTVWEADIRIAVGKVEPHEFAGFSGGRKSVLPGVSAEDSIRINHRPELLLHPKATPGCLDGNPIHLDMLEAAKKLGIHFCVNILVDSNNRVGTVVCGDLDQSHRQAVELLRKNIGVHLKTSPAIVVTTPGVPLNVNLYQSIKPLIALAPIMRRKGVVVLYSECAEGVDSDDMILPFRQSSDLNGVLNYLERNYTIQMDHALLLTKILQTGLRIVAVSPNVSDEILALLHITPARSLSEAIGKAFELLDRKEKVLFFPQPQRTLPYVE